MKTGEYGKKARTGKSLNLVLWMSFSLFALVIVVIYAVLQNILVFRQYRERAETMIREVGQKMARQFEVEVNPSYALSKTADIAVECGVTVYLLRENGEIVYPVLTEQTSNTQIAEALARSLSNNKEVVYESEGQVAYGTVVTLSGEGYFLYAVYSLDASGFYSGGFLLMSVITGLFAIVLAFVASAFVAVFITKPITEVTEQAKEFARGNYNLHFRRDYFCSEIGELSEALDYARSEISKTDEMQKELIANVSHDFKTPLTMIKAYASMIQEISGEDKAKRDAHTQIIIDESDRLTALVTDLLDLSKLRAGFSRDAFSVFNLSEEVYRIAGRFDYLTQTEGYTIETAVEDEIYICACRERIEQVLYNLIGNAVNYTGEDKRVRVRLSRRGNASRFEVIDSGKGIPPEEIDTIWDRYYRSKKSHKRPVGGTGLGLSIVKSILRAQNCPFGVISEVGKGSCFWVEFPSPEPAPEEEKHGKGKKEAE